MVSTVKINQRFDEAAYTLRHVLGQLEVAREPLEWIDTVSRPTQDGPNPKDEAAMRAYTIEVHLALARVLLDLQHRAEALEAKLQKTKK